MKFSRGFSILILLSILSSLAFAVTCPIKIGEGIVFSGSKTCDDACAYFTCIVQYKPETGIKPIVEVGVGCPKDFYDKCSKYASSEVDFIQKKSPNRMDFFSAILYLKNANSVAVEYISGCGGETDGTKCLQDHYTRAKNDSKAVIASHDNDNGVVYWKDEKDSFVGESLDAAKSATSAPQNHAYDDGPSGISNGQDYDQKSGSNGQNGAFKFIGIIIFGWILFAAAWIY